MVIKECCQQRTHFSIAFVMGGLLTLSHPLSQGSLHPVTGCCGGTEAGAIITTPDDSPQAVMPELRKIPSASELPQGWPRPLFCYTTSQLFLRSISASSLPFCRHLSQEHSPVTLLHGMLTLPLSGLHWHRVKHHHHLC